MPLKMLHLRSIPVILKVLLHRKGRALCPSRSCVRIQVRITFQT